VTVSTALVTGITGQDGGYLAEQLVSEDTQVHGLVRGGEAVPEHLTALGDGVILHEVELTDAARLAGVFEHARPDEVYNLAGVSSVALSWQEPALTAEVNGVAAARLLELAWRQQEQTGLRTGFVQASSAEIFAGTDSVPQNEQTALSPRSPYGASKAFAHHMTQVYRARGLHAVNVILYNHESPRRPVTFVTRKITVAAAAMARGEVAELVLGNLDARRDWGWAPDYVRAMTSAVRASEPDDFVIATGEAHSVRDFVAGAMRHAGVADWESRVRVDPAFSRPTDATELRGDAAKARAVLGWVPSLTFDGLVERMVEQDMRTG
jgi:GDPmannose 4,6-dehydratase